MRDEGAETADDHVRQRRALEMIRMSLAFRNLLFTLAVPGTGGIVLPWLILTRGDASPTPVAWPAVAVIAAGVLLLLWCQWVFARVGRGTPGPWDPPRRVIAVGPYRLVRNRIYIAALVIILGESWLFGSTALLLYGGVAAVVFHLFVTGYEEPKLRAQFGEQYEAYRFTVPRWIPRWPGETHRRVGVGPGDPRGRELRP